MNKNFDTWKFSNNTDIATFLHILASKSLFWVQDPRERPRIARARSYKYNSFLHFYIYISPYSRRWRRMAPRISWPSPSTRSTAAPPQAPAWTPSTATTNRITPSSPQVRYHRTSWSVVLFEPVGQCCGSRSGIRCFFLASGSRSGIRERFFPDPGGSNSRSPTHISETFVTIFLVCFG